MVNANNLLLTIAMQAAVTTASANPFHNHSMYLGYDAPLHVMTSPNMNTIQQFASNLQQWLVDQAPLVPSRPSIPTPIPLAILDGLSEGATAPNEEETPNGEEEDTC